MEKRTFDLDYRFRPAKPSEFWTWALRPLRRAMLRRMFRVHELELRNQHVAQEAIKAGGGIMFAFNHPAHGDPFVVLEAMHRIAARCCYLAAWQVFTGFGGLKGWAMQRLGAFSIDREGADMSAFRAAVEVLAEGHRALVIFPEGEVYHINDRLTPLREGAALIALMAAKRRARGPQPPALPTRPLHIVPAAIKYFYIDDPTPALREVMTRLEKRLYWRPRTDFPLVERIYHYAGAILALKEMEYLGEFGNGPLPQRIRKLSGHILSQMEARRLTHASAQETIPIRVKQLRQRLLKEFDARKDGGPPRVGAETGAPSIHAPLSEDAIRDLDDLHLVTQLFSYPGDYLADKPTTERIAETLDKFEEDALGRECVVARAARRAVISFGEPIDVSARLSEGKRAAHDAAGTLTTLIETRIQRELDTMPASQSEELVKR